MNPLWYPYAQMQHIGEYPRVERAEGMYFFTDDGNQLLDGISSWWCKIHGYNHPRLNKALRRQTEKISHIMMGGLITEPARRLAEKLGSLLPGSLNHVFYSDSGSVGMEVALKMALQYQQLCGQSGRKKFVTLKGGYHGDTMATMAITSPEGSFHRTFASLLEEHYYVDRPRGGRSATPAEVAADHQALEGLLEQHGRHIAGLVLEPLLQGAGGYYYYSPLYLDGLREICDRHGLLLIYDEIATGFGRTGSLFALEQTGSIPDIVVLGKALTGGMLGHAATVANDRVYEAFYGDEDTVFMHGPTFMGNALSCAVALESCELFFEAGYLKRISQIEARLNEQLLPLQARYSSQIEECRVLGASGVVEVKDAASLEGFNAFAFERGVWLRPFGKIVYTAPAYIISDDELDRIVAVIDEWFAGRPG